MSVGMYGRVTSSPPYPNSLNLLPGRPSRNPSNYRLALIPVGGTFTVTAGPICADELAWWQVNFNGLIGWTAEGEGRVYWLEPAGIVPPPTPQPNVCTLAPRLIVGQRGVVTPGLPNALRSQPSRNRAISAVIGQIPGTGIFTVLAGPVCGDGLYWYQANYNGIIGWTAEGENGVYWLEPSGIVPPSPQPAVCTLAPRLTVGQRGVVTPGLPNSVRSQPNRNNNTSAVIGEIPGTGIFTVLAGPVCGDGLYWYQVNYNGLIGWTAEGQNGVYWLEPSGIVPPSPQPYCPLTPRLTVGGVGRVTPGTPNALRSAPGRNRNTSSVIGEIPGGSVFAVLAGPTCADGFYWWQVTYAGQVGWTAEGEGGVYWLEPWQ
jgi:hypothetical protein